MGFSEDWEQISAMLPPQPVDATLYLKRKDGVSADEAKISSRV